MKTETLARAIIPAEPNWAVAVFIEEGTPCFVFDPIIAWHIYVEAGNYHPAAKARAGDRWEHTTAIPITADGNPDNHANRWAIRRPNGTISVPFDREFADEDEALEYFVANMKEELQRKSA